jgi:hypothetical protein
MLGNVHLEHRLRGAAADLLNLLRVAIQNLSTGNGCRLSASSLLISSAGSIAIAV